MLARLLKEIFLIAFYISNRKKSAPKGSPIFSKPLKPLQVNRGDTSE